MISGSSFYETYLKLILLQLRSKHTKSEGVVYKFDMKCPSCSFDISLSLKAVILRTCLGYFCKPTVKYYGMCQIQSFV